MKDDKQQLQGIIDSSHPKLKPYALAPKIGITTTALQDFLAGFPVPYSSERKIETYIEGVI